METSSIVLLVVTATVSFGLGRTVVHLRNKKRNKLVQALAAQALANPPAETSSTNKSKRKRQLSAARRARS
jgi:hypothetical protein